VLLTILLPCRDEADTVADCVLAARALLTRRAVDGEVLVVDNASTDGSGARARAAGARVVEAPEPGYGSALNVGIAHARGRFTIMADCDGSYDLAAADALLDRLLAGDELVVGDRFAGGIAPGAMPWLHRYVGNPVLSWLGRRLFGVTLRDLHCGLRGFDTRRVRALDLRTTGMEWATEMIVAAATAGMRIGEVPVPLHVDRRRGRPHLRTWADGWRHLRLLLLLSPRWLFLYPGVVATGLGLVATTVLSLTPVRIGRFGFDIATLLYAAALTLLGHGLLWFAAISERLAGRLGVGTRPARTAPVWWPGWRLERGLVVGGVLAAGGIALAVASLVRWRAAGFAAVDPTTTVRIVVPAVLSLVLGVQMAFSSLLLSVVDLPTRAAAPDVAADVPRRWAA